jgi:hypothetical protein
MPHAFSEHCIWCARPFATDGMPCPSTESIREQSLRIAALPWRRLPSKPNDARLRPAAHYAKALRAFDCCVRSASSSNGNEIATPAVSLPKGQNLIEENKPADAPRLRRGQDRTGHHLLGRNWRRLIMARRWSMPTNHRSETDAATGEESEYTTPFLKGYTVFNVEQIDGLPEHNYAKTAPRIDTIERAESIALFELKDDRRPAAERTAAGRVSGANFVCRGYEAGSLQPPLQVGGPQEGDGCDRRRYVRLAADFVGCDRCDEKRRSSKD